MVSSPFHVVQRVAGHHLGPEGAARACELIGARQVVPMHYGTYPALTGTPSRLRELVEPHGVTVLELRPGETAG